MHILMLSAEHNQVVAVLRDAAMRLLHASSHGVQAAAPAVHAMLDGLHHSNLPFCGYAAAGCALGFASYLAYKDSKLEHARDQALHSAASLILAVIHLLG